MTTHLPRSAIRRITILSADDHSLIRAGIAALIATEPDLELVAEAVNGEEALEQYHRLRPDVVLMDLHMPMMDGVDATAAIVAEFPAASIIVLTTFDDDDDIVRAIDVGAKGYLLKDMLRTEVIGAIRAACTDRFRVPQSTKQARHGQAMPRVMLTPRELEVLRLVAQRLDDHAIGRRLSFSEQTASVHIKNSMRKLGASDRLHAVTLARQRGLLHDE